MFAIIRKVFRNTFLYVRYVYSGQRFAKENFILLTMFCVFVGAIEKGDLWKGLNV